MNKRRYDSEKAKVEIMEHAVSLFSQKAIIKHLLAIFPPLQATARDIFITILKTKKSYSFF